MPAIYGGGRPNPGTVRASSTYSTSTASTNTSDVYPLPAAGIFGVRLYVDQSAVSATSAGGGTGVMTHTIQAKDPISGNYISSTGVVTCTTGVATWALTCYPGAATVAPTSSGVGSANFAISGAWRVQSSASSSATSFDYSVSAEYIPVAGSSS